MTELIGGEMSDDDVRKRLAIEMDNQRLYQLQYWPLFFLETGEFVGCCGFRPYRLEDAVYEFGVHLLPEWWKRGLAFEASQAAVAFAFRELKVSGLFAGHHPDNTNSGSLLLRLGFRYTHDEFYPPTALNHPSYLLGRPGAERPRGGGD